MTDEPKRCRFAAEEDDEDRPDYLECERFTFVLSESGGALRLTFSENGGSRPSRDGWFSILHDDDSALPEAQIYLGHDDMRGLVRFLRNCADACERAAELNEREGKEQ